MWFEALATVGSVMAGGLAAVTASHPSLLTPILALQVDTRLAVAAVSIPHVLGTALRFWLLKGGVDCRVLWSFGLTSAAGGLIGAALQGWLGNRWLDVVFGALLSVCRRESGQWTGGPNAIPRTVAWLAGALSGLLGGLVGNQGGIRSAALLGFDLPKHTFVATATAIGLFVDGAWYAGLCPNPRTRGSLIFLAPGGAASRSGLRRHGARQPLAGPHTRGLGSTDCWQAVLALLGTVNDVPGRCRCKRCSADGGSGMTAMITGHRRHNRHWTTLHSFRSVHGVRYQVKDVACSVAFYTQRLGFTLRHQQLPAFANVSLGDSQILLSGPGASGSRPMPDGEPQEPGGWNRVVLKVADLPGFIAELKDAGLRFRNEMEVGPGGRQIQIEDPDGNAIELFEPAR